MTITDVIISDSGNEHVILTDENIAIINRINVVSAMHKPLSDYEELLNALCSKIIELSKKLDNIE